ncbi:hypothetical protein ACF090_02085 [Streptomyces sp. NPDC014892]|uniref:hypothetical protein n=1 Tax=Streptomyces sp. NPDC014892 TaxID=3364930 RepID=UPI0036F57F0A
MHALYGTERRMLEEAMKLAVLVAVLLIVGAVVATVARRRSVEDPRPSSDLDAEAEANRWVVRLGGSLAGIDVRAQARAGGSAAESLTEATERLRTARAQLTRARTPDEYARVTRTAVEGLRHVGEARAALGVDTGPGPGAGPAGGEGSRAGSGVPDGGGQGEVPVVASVRTAIRMPLDQVSRVVRKSERPSRAARRSVSPAP